ncbi:MAG TPA: hypothetical protein VNH18_28110 [Bryobacteraceae bacterium]|nr:hypothetical protein [Bryobacteraceae bacterium]
MKKFLIIATLAAALGVNALATDSPSLPRTQTILLSPYGTWALCGANPSMAGSPFCQGQPAYVKGQEPDLLLVSAEHPDTVAFAYIVTGTDLNGQNKTYSGTFLRNDRPPYIIASYTVINAGMLRGVTITIQELSATQTRQQYMDSTGN